MSRTYKLLKQNIFEKGSYTLIPLRDKDKFSIMKWRNEQLSILRQKYPLTREQQSKYFKDVVAMLFKQEQPSQILWSFLLSGELVGYGGLVHIDWESRNAEISFLVSTERNEKISNFRKDWNVYLDLVERVAFQQLRLHKLYTYAYNIRPHYFEVMYKKGYKKEAQLRQHVMVDGKLQDVLILSKFSG